MDGSVASFHFEAKELGHRLTDIELDELKKNRYGDVRGRQANLAESPAQLLFEAASAKQAPNKKVIPDVQQRQVLVKPSVDVGAATKASETQVDDRKKSGAASGESLNKVSGSTRISSPVKQREYRRPDGRKRIIPEAVGVPVHQEDITSGAQSQAPDFPVMSSDHGKEDSGLAPADCGFRGSSMRGALGRSPDLKERSGVTTRAMITDNLVIEKVPSTTCKDGCINVEQSSSVKASNSSDASSTSLLIRVFDKKEGEETIPICLEARPREHALNDIFGMGSTFIMKETEITCMRGSLTLWSDRISGNVTVLAGNSNFWAVGCEDGCLQVGLKSFFTLIGIYFVLNLFCSCHLVTFELSAKYLKQCNFKDMLYFLFYPLLYTSHDNLIITSSFMLHSVAPIIKRHKYIFFLSLLAYFFPLSFQ